MLSTLVTLVRITLLRMIGGYIIIARFEPLHSHVTLPKSNKTGDQQTLRRDTEKDYRWVHLNAGNGNASGRFGDHIYVIYCGIVVMECILLCYSCCVRPPYLQQCSFTCSSNTSTVIPLCFPKSKTINKV